MAEKTSKPEDKKTTADKKPAAPSASQRATGPRELPLVALRETVIFPEMIVPAPGRSREERQRAQRRGRRLVARSPS